jgi:hypothetical protein
VPERPAAVHVHGYQHLDHGVRYTVLYEPGDDDAHVLLGASQTHLGRTWAAWAPRGYRIASLSSHVDGGGTLRHSAVLRPGGPRQQWVAGRTAAQIADDSRRQWERGWAIRHVTLVHAPDGHRWSAVFEPASGRQLVRWAAGRAHVRAIHAERRADGFALRALWTAPA